MTKQLRDGETVVITCESCEPELAVIIDCGPSCFECGYPQYRLRTSEAGMVVVCCATILRPLN